MNSGTETGFLNQFPQPVRPPNSYDLSFQPSNLDLGFQQRREAEEAMDHSHMNVVPPFTSEKAGERKNIPEEIVKRILEMQEKLPESMRDQLNLEDILSKLDRNGGFQNSKELKSRGLDQRLPQESSHKLERFKIRTVTAEEVVKEEDKK